MQTGRKDREEKKVWLAGAQRRITGRGSAWFFPPMQEVGSSAAELGKAWFKAEA